jgi:hypothetical protein
MRVSSLLVVAGILEASVGRHAIGGRVTLDRISTRTGPDEVSQSQGPRRSRVSGDVLVDRE